MSIVTSAPYADLKGFKDNSIPARQVAPVELPQHLPLIPIVGERGEFHPMLLPKEDALRIYGDNTFELNSRFANHSTVLATTVQAEGNVAMYVRMALQGQKRSMVRLMAEILETNIPTYQRNDDDTFTINPDGTKIPTGNNVAGTKVRWYLEAIASEGDIKQGVETVGSLTDSTGAKSKCLPILDIPATHMGLYGDKIGFRLSAPTIRSAIPANDALIADQEAQLYRLQFVEKKNPQRSPVVTQTLDGQQYVEFMFKDGAVDNRFERAISFDDIVPNAYSSNNPASGIPPEYGPADNIFVYENNIETLLTTLHSKEVAVKPNMLAKESMNMFTGVNFDGVPYETVDVLGTADNGIVLNETNTHYLRGGNDGDLSIKSFEDAVEEFFDNFSTGQYNLLDSAKNPFSIVYDSGYRLSVKKKLFKALVRKDVSVTAGTQVAGEAQLTPAEEYSTLIALREAARQYPESELHGTATVRATIVGNSMELAQSKFKGIVPMTIDLAQKRARFMGAGDGSLKPGLGYDEEGNNLVTMGYGVNNTYKPRSSRVREWEAGLVWVQSYDHKSLFYPAVQTVYSEEASILNADINMLIGTNLQRICEQTWRRLTGNSKLTDAQFIARSNRLITEATEGIYDDRVVIRPETFVNNDGSWACLVHMYGSNQKVLGAYTVVAQNRRDL